MSEFSVVFEGAMISFLSIESATLQAADSPTTTILSSSASERMETSSSEPSEVSSIRSISKKEKNTFNIILFVQNRTF